MNTQNKIKLALDRSNLTGAKKLTAMLLEEEHKAEWDKNKKAEYDALLPITRDMVEEEYLNSLKDADGNLPNTYTKYTDLVDIPQITIQYVTQDEDENKVRTPSNYVTYSEWINETKVITPEVKEVSHLDKNGMKVIDTPCQAEITELVRPYTSLEVTDELVNDKLEAFEEYREYIKKVKTKAKENVVVTKNKVGYQGDPMSINYMSAIGAISAMKMFQVMVRDGIITPEQYAEVYKTNTGWKGVDNAIHRVQIESVIEACELSMLEQAKVAGIKQ